MDVGNLVAVEMRGERLAIRHGVRVAWDALRAVMVQRHDENGEQKYRHHRPPESATAKLGGNSNAREPPHEISTNRSVLRNSAARDYGRASARPPASNQPPRADDSLLEAHTFITILEGEITNIPIVDGQKAEPVVYGPGDSFIEPAWEGQEAGNNGAVRARWLQTRLVPRGVPAAVNLPIPSSRPDAPDVTVPYTASMEILNVSGHIDVYQSWTEFSPGDQMPPHFHPGAELILVTDGELTSMKSATTTVLAGEAIRNQPGEIRASANRSTEQTRVVTTHLIASGRPQAFPSGTGSADAEDRDE
ncbi:MAG TPA: cupin domain-containing protein [Chloroflexota bacterium]|nr:cupin domain-containing protein [Chloroflexota bacterium]